MKKRKGKKAGETRRRRRGKGEREDRKGKSAPRVKEQYFPRDFGVSPDYLRLEISFLKAKWLHTQLPQRCTYGKNSRNRSLTLLSTHRSFAQITVALNFSTLLTLRTILSYVTRSSRSNLYIGNFPFPTAVSCNRKIEFCVEGYKLKKVRFWDYD